MKNSKSRKTIKNTFFQLKLKAERIWGASPRRVIQWPGTIESWYWSPEAQNCDRYTCQDTITLFFLKVELSNCWTVELLKCKLFCLEQDIFFLIFFRSFVVFSPLDLNEAASLLFGTVTTVAPGPVSSIWPLGSLDRRSKRQNFEVEMWWDKNWVKQLIFF